MDVQQLFINSIAVASHPVCPPSNRKTYNSWSSSHFLQPASEKCWSGCEEEIRCKPKLPAPCPFMSYLFSVFLWSLSCCAGPSLLTMSLRLWAFSSSPTFARIHTICHLRCFLCALTRDQFNTSHASCLYAG